MRQVVLYVAVSLDGFIAKPTEDLSFKYGLSEQNLKLIDTKHFDTGLVQLFYELSND